MAKRSATELVSVTEAAEALGFTRRHIHNLILDRLLPAEKIGNAYVIRRSDLLKVPKDRKPGPKAKTRIEDGR